MSKMNILGRTLRELKRQIDKIQFMICIKRLENAQSEPSLQREIAMRLVNERTTEPTFLTIGEAVRNSYATQIGWYYVDILLLSCFLCD